MQSYLGRVREISLDENGLYQAWIACPAGATPACGQYVRARAAGFSDAPLAERLFQTARRQDGFLAAAPIPAIWAPGMELTLSSPIGRGFGLPANARRVAAAVFSPTASRLLPLVEQALANKADVSIFADTPPAWLPARVEINPLKALPENLGWADFLTIDLPLEMVPNLPDMLGLTSDRLLPCPGQALVWSPMPCGGLAQCGACAVKCRHGYKLACEDGPVFNLRDLV